MTREYERVSLQSAKKIGNPKPGLSYSYFEGKWSSLPAFRELTPVRKGVADKITIGGYADKEDEIGLVFEGYVQVPESGIFTLFTESDDGSRLYINDKMIVDNDGLHGRQTRMGQVALEKGYHQVRIEFFESGGGEFLRASMVGEGFPRELLAEGSIFH